MDKKEDDIIIYTYNNQGKTTISKGEVKIIQQSYSKDSLNSDELILLNEINKNNQSTDNHSHTSETIEKNIESRSIASSSEKHNDYTSQTKILSSEEKSDCGTFDCMGKNDDFCCVII